MYRLKLPGNLPDIESLIDNLIEQPYVELNNSGQSRKLGFYTKDLPKGVLKIYWNRELKESIAILKVKEATKKNGKGKSIEYILGDKIKSPKILAP